MKKDLCFEITSTQFLNFAKQDSGDESLHSRVNALSNVKRAIECRIDELLYCYCIYRKSEVERWYFPKKIQVLGDIGILAPRILQRINAKRNQLEHSYIKPTKSDIDDAIDVATLFIAYTNALCDPFRSIGMQHQYNITFDRKNTQIVLEEGEKKEVMEIDTKDEWIEIAKIFVGVISRFTHMK